MNAEINVTAEQTIVVISGRIDTTNVQEFDKKLKPVFEQKPARLVLDCAQLEYISSSGLRVFLILQKTVMAYNGSLVLRAMRPEIKEVFDMTGFSSIFTLE